MYLIYSAGALSFSTSSVSDTIAGKSSLVSLSVLPSSSSLT